MVLIAYKWPICWTLGQAVTTTYITGMGMITLDLKRISDNVLSYLYGTNINTTAQ